MKKVFAIIGLLLATSSAGAQMPDLKIIAPNGVNLNTSLEVRRIRPWRPFLLPFRRRIAAQLGPYRYGPPRQIQMNTNVQFPSPKK